MSAGALPDTDNGRYVFSSWSAKAHGTYQAPWNILVTPAVRLQAGQPYVLPEWTEGQSFKSLKALGRDAEADTVKARWAAAR